MPANYELLDAFGQLMREKSVDKTVLIETLEAGLLSAARRKYGKRGIFIMMLDPLWMSLGFGEGIVLQVLYCIGASFCAMALLRRLGMRSLLIICLGILFFSEALAGLALWAGGGKNPA